MMDYLILVLCLVVCGVAANHRNGEHPRTVYACEGSTISVDCGDLGESRKIYVIRANYGRQNVGICNDGSDTSGWNLQCLSTRAPRTVSTMCNGRSKCDLQVVNRIFGDPCYLTPKYLEVQFECRKDFEETTDKPHGSVLPKDISEQLEIINQGRNISRQSKSQSKYHESKITSSDEELTDINSQFDNLIAQHQEVFTNGKKKHDLDHDLGQGHHFDLDTFLDSEDDNADVEHSGVESYSFEETVSIKKVSGNNVSYHHYENKGYSEKREHISSNGNTDSGGNHDHGMKPETTPVPPTTTSQSTTTTPKTTPKPITTTTITTSRKTTPPTKPSVKPTKPSLPPLRHTTTERMSADQGRPKNFCDEQVQRGVTWPRTPKGAWSIQECPNNRKVRKAMWKCAMEPVAWEGKPNLSGCQSQELEDLGRKLALAKEEFSMDIVTEVASELQKTSEKTDLFGGDISEMSKIMKDMVGTVETQSKNTSRPISKRMIENITNSVLTTSSNMLADGKDDTWTDLPQAIQAETATRVVSAVEESAYTVADTYEQPTVVVNVTMNIILEVNVINTRSDIMEDIVFPRASRGQASSAADNWMGQGNSITLTGDSIRDLGVEGLARVIFLTYNNLEKWLNPMSSMPSATGYSDDRYIDYNHPVEELRERESIVFDPHDIEFQPMNPEIEHIPAEDFYPVDAQDLGPLDESSNQLPEEESHDLGYDNEVNDLNLVEIPTEDENNGAATTIEPVVVEEEKPNDTTRVVNSQIISASVLQKNKEADGTESKVKGHIPLSEPVMYTLEHKTTNNVYNPTCSFWEYSEKTLSGRWSTFGCKVHDTNQTHTTCACNHLTNFAVLMDVKGVAITAPHEFALAFITYLGCVISIVCLFICFMTFTVFKNLQCDRNTIHKNLVLCLFIAELLFLIGIMQHARPVLCAVMAGILHYFFLAAFMWMLMEGIQLYVMLVEVFEAEKSRVKYYYLASYGTPAIIVGISAAVSHEGYGTENHCWLSTEGGFIWAFVGPVCVIISINIVMLSIAIYQMCKHANSAAAWKMKQKSKMENIRSWLKGASVLVVLLGLTWAFGLLYLDQNSLFMAYIFTILNSLQGLFIFIFHCAMNEKVQKEYKRSVRRATWLPETLRVKYGGAKPYASTSPNQSSSSGGNKTTAKTTKNTHLETRVSLEYLTKLLGRRRRKRSSTATINSSLSNPSKSGHYQNMKHDATSPRESAHISDSGIGRHPDSLYANEDDNGGYLEPISLRVNDRLLNDLEAGMEFSMMEGSCVDTDCYGTEGKPPAGKSQAPIDVDKYKIKNPNRLSTLSDMQPISESDYSDGELLKMAENDLPLDEYHSLIPKSKSELALLEDVGSDSYDTLLQKKLKQFAAESEDSIPEKCNMNNLNKGDNEMSRDSVNLSTPNIHANNIYKGDTLTKANLNQSGDHKGSLPSVSDKDNSPSASIEKLKKVLATSNDGLSTVESNQGGSSSRQSYSEC